EFTPPKNELDRIVQFQRLILVMNVDKSVSEEELLHVRNIGIRMGLQPNATNSLLRLMEEYENGVIPPDKLISVFRSQHN
ncbi:MAG: TerB family tellurite resistance protein, partial [Crocinitomicaceae bacterium]